MSRLVAVTRREFGAALDGPTARVAALAFAFTLQALFFFAGFPVGERRLPGFWEAGQASLQVVHDWLPLLFVPLAAALTMGAWADERRSGTEELLLSWPIDARDLVLGKFAAHLGLLALVLGVAALPLVATAAWLGPLDPWVATTGLVGALLLGAGYLAIGQLLSALTRDPLVAFLLAGVVLLVSWSPTLLVRLVPGQWADLVWLASPAAHYLDSAARGLFDARDLLFHGLLAAAALHLSIWVVEARRWR